MTGSISNSSAILGFRNHNFGVVGGSVGGPPALDLSEFPSLGGSSSNTVFYYYNFNLKLNFFISLLISY
jgi:hypothetical protein